MKKLGLILFAALLLQLNLKGQQNAVSGQNIIQYDQFAWKYVETDHFEIHYYSREASLAAMVGKYAEESLYDVCKTLNYKNSSRFALYIFLSPADLAQSNMFPQELIKYGGVTPLRNNSAPFIFPGSMNKTQKVVREKVAKMLIEDYYFGGGVQKSIQRTVLLHLPKWYIEGISSFIGEGWTYEDEMWMNSLENTRMLEFALEGDGHLEHFSRKSIWHYIATQFGKDKLSEIFYMTRLTRSVEDGVIHVLGLTLKTLTERWREFILLKITQNKFGRHKVADMGTPIDIDPKDRLLGYALNPAQRQVAMLLDRDGMQSMVIRNLDNDEEALTEIKGGFKTDQFERFNLEMPLVWSPNGKHIAGTIFQNGHEVLFFYQTETEKATYFPYHKQLDRIFDLNWSHDGKSLVCSGLRNGSMDIYRFAYGATGFKAVTSDAFENLNPVFSLDDQRIYYASNRPNDSILDSEVRFDNYRDHYDLWEIDLSDKELRQVTHTPQSDEFPVAANSSFEIMVMTNESGVFNLQRKNVFVGDSTYHTNFDQGLHSVSYSDRELVYALPQQGSIALFVAKSEALASQDVVVNTEFRARKEKAWRQKQRIETAKSLKDSLAQVPVDSLPSTEEFKTPEVEEPKVKYYVFDEEDAQPRTIKKRFSHKRKKLTKEVELRPDFNEVKIKGPSSSEAGWTSDQVSTQLGFDPVFRFSMSFEARLKNHLGDKSLVVGYRPFFDFKSSDAWIGYGNKKHKVDYFVGVERSTRYLRRLGFSSRYNRSTVRAEAVLPVNRFLSMGAGLHSSYVNRFNIETIIPRNFDANDIFAGLNLNLTYDKRNSEGGFTKSGIYFRADLSNAFSVFNTRNEFLTAQLDLRKYLPIKKFVFASRLSAGWSTGENPQNFFMGGIDQSLFSSFLNASDFPMQANLSDFHYMKYLTPVHGFKYNARNGSKYVIANAELRIPVSRAFRSALNSKQLYNLEIIPFFDFGTAWDEGNPLSQKNPIDTETINSYPLNITVQTLKSPFVMGFGAGARAKLLGYQVRADLAWGIEDYSILNPRLHVSLGKNF